MRFVGVANNVAKPTGLPRIIWNSLLCYVAFELFYSRSLSLKRKITGQDVHTFSFPKMALTGITKLKKERANVELAYMHCIF